MLGNIPYNKNGDHCISYKKNTANKNSSARRTKQNRKYKMLISNCAAWGKKKRKSIKNQEASTLELHK